MIVTVTNTHGFVGVGGGAGGAVDLISARLSVCVCQ